jgi:hypothetical protein
LLATHVCPLSQLVPHAPQFFALVVMSTQLPLQFM